MKKASTNDLVFASNDESSVLVKVCDRIVVVIFKNSWFQIMETSSVVR